MQLVNALIKMLSKLTMNLIRPLVAKKGAVCIYALTINAVSIPKNLIMFLIYYCIFLCHAITAKLSPISGSIFISTILILKHAVKPTLALTELATLH
jgi:hypothetical protein